VRVYIYISFCDQGGNVPHFCEKVPRDGESDEHKSRVGPWGGAGVENCR
jgi:hypothetical protein